MTMLCEQFAHLASASCDDCVDKGTNDSDTGEDGKGHCFLGRGIL